MRRTFRRKKYKPDKSKFRANDKIRVDEVRVIDADGSMLGVMLTEEAKAIALEKGFDLVEVNPKASPPVVKFLDFGKFQYERDKELMRQKKTQKKVETKGIRLSFRISAHDRDVRLRQSVKFLEKGHKVKIELTLRGRENAYKDQAIDMVKQFIEDTNQSFDQEVIIEAHPKKESGRITAIIANKKS